MKVLTFEVEEVDHKQIHPHFIKIRPKNLSLSLNVLDDMKPLDSEYSTFLKEVYPMQTFAYGSIRNEYYIRDKDKKVFEDLINAYVKRAENKTKRETIETIKHLLIKVGTGEVANIIQRLDNVLKELE